MIGRERLSEIERSVLRFIAAHQPVTYQELSDGCAIAARSTAVDVVLRLEQRRLVSREPFKSRTLRIAPWVVVTAHGLIGRYEPVAS